MNSSPLYLPNANHSLSSGDFLWLLDKVTGYEKTGLSPDGALLVRNRGRLVELYDVKSQQRTGLLDGHTSIEAIAFHGEDRFVTADSNGSILVWDRNAIEAIGGGHEVIKEEFA